MGRNLQPVCVECTQKCRLFHGKQKSSASLCTSFFRIVCGDDVSKLMYIPPKFALTVSCLVGKQIILRDSRGEQWNVKISMVNDSYAFEEGWNAFYLAHGLEYGYFLIFNYISESGFIVSIFDTSACEKLHFSKKRNQKKRSRDTSGDGLLVGQGSKPSVVSKPDVPKMECQHREVDLGGTQNNTQKFSNYDNCNGRPQTVCIEEHFEDPCYMTSRGFGDIERDDLTSMFDVLDCEILHNCAVDGTGKHTTGDSKVSHVDYGSHGYQNEAIICNKDPLFGGILDRGAASDPSDFELSGRNNSLGQKDKISYDKNSTLKLEENRESNSIMFNRKAREGQLAEGLESEQVAMCKKRHGLYIGGFHNTKRMFNGIRNSLDAIPHGEMMKMTNKKHVDTTPSFCSLKDRLRSTGQMSKGIKKEPVDISPNMYKDELLATGKMSKGIKKESVDRSPSVNKDELLATGKMPKRIKRELEDMTPKVYKDELQATGMSKVIKEEPGQCSHTFDQDDGNDIQTAATISCVVPTENDSSLELPAPLPFSHRGRVKMERMVVYLRDRSMRLWPVLYHERSCFKALTNGWLDYRRANNIQPTDVCIFGVENDLKRIITVDIVHK